mmetsp:Transcript_14935/g.44374  ORF Transcript_14935/g.44374 Transcript_14935/m.44374 type:complete len:272 (+) Transcript_14935:35-850(+)
MAPKVGFIGAGMMAQALAGGLIKNGYTTKDDVIASDKYEPCRKAVTEKLGVRSTDDNVEVVKNATIIVLAVKPNDINAAIESINPALTSDHLLVSIAAGITTASIEAACAAERRVVRVMPNTPAQVGEVAAAVAPGSACRPGDVDEIVRMLGSVGTAVQVDESKLDAITGLSGSGPAYGFLAIEALADGGVRAGLPRGVALKMAAQTMLGAAKMVLETGTHPGELKDRVCSPGGTTIAGVHALEIGGFRASLINAVVAAAARSSELATEKK